MSKISTTFLPGKQPGLGAISDARTQYRPPLPPLQSILTSPCYSESLPPNSETRTEASVWANVVKCPSSSCQGWGWGNIQAVSFLSRRWGPASYLNLWEVSSKSEGDKIRNWCEKKYAKNKDLTITLAPHMWEVVNESCRCQGLLQRKGRQITGW